MASTEKKFLDFVGATEIALIQLIDSSFSIKLPAEKIVIENLKMSHNLDFGVAFEENEAFDKIKSPHQLFCFVGLEVIGSFKPDDPILKKLPDGIAFTAKCRFAARYLVRQDAQLARVHVDEFAEKFSIPHAYPYIRSYFDNTFAQMGLNRIVLPLLRQSSGQPKEEAKVQPAETI